MTCGHDMIAQERYRQIGAEGFGAEHDDKTCGDLQLLDAAACYLHAGTCGYEPDVPPVRWPWSPEWWKPGSAVRNLVKAGALIAAEIDRLNRIAANDIAGCDEPHYTSFIDPERFM